MIDFRHQTFLELCQIKNYTKTAKKLHITQPTVSQHIKHLEKYYGLKLFNYSGKKLKITEAGKKLYQYTQRMSADSREIKKILQEKNGIKNIKFGATLSIGEFVMPEILIKAMNQNPMLNFDMLVENTQTLIRKLKKGEINFAILEGFFDKSKFGHQLFSKEEFIGVSSFHSKYCDHELEMEDLLDSCLILREKGSGTRDILEQLLYENNLRKESFKNIIEIGNMSAIKKMVAKNKGITFMYRAAAEKELKNNLLAPLKVIDFEVKREFNFVYLKDSVFAREYLNYFKKFINLRKNK